MNKQQAWHQGWPVIVNKVGGPGSGWFGPPRGTHGPGSRGGEVRDKTAAQMRAELKRDAKRKYGRMADLKKQSDQLAARHKKLGEEQMELFAKRAQARREGQIDDEKRLTAQIKNQSNKMNKTFDQIAKTEHEYWNVRNSIRKSAREKLKVANPADFETDIGKLRKAKAELQEGADGFASLMGRGTLDGQTVTMRTTTGNRGHYKNDGVYLPPINRRSKVVAHELGHWLEDRDRDAHARALAFLQKRTEGEKAITLRQATGNPNYRADEITKKDKFMHPYSGKQYPGGYATEIISMGVEHMYSEPVEFATKDPEYFDFMYNLMRGQY